MAAPALKVLKRLAYAPPAWKTTTVSLSFDIRKGSTTVVSELTLVRNHTADAGPLVLNHGNAASMKLVSITLDGKALTPDDYVLDASTMTLAPPAAVEGFTLRIVTEITPETNTALEGLYHSGSTYCSQCEAEGFRHITFYQDRPDVMAIWQVRVEGDRATCPVLLSNGNLVEAGDLPDGRHFTRWHDPFPKPCYLFAVVAGDLAKTESSFVTCSGKTVALRIFTAARDAGKVAWAMESLKKAFAWEEATFGLEYDLDLFNIVAVDDFTMGAMENKSLNIFNSRLVLATRDTASDMDFGRIEGVIAHELLHNWTGDRVTCRDWFQLTLKEGLTVYRDQEFSADLNSRPVKRIEDVTRLRQSQFGEDAGPMAHPIRPDEVGKMDNFYTATVYEKGAEVVRLYATVLGRDGFRKGMDLYFKRHDGQAVTCDDFWQAMHDANASHPGVGALEALKTWYSQAGTPEVTVTPVYDAAARTLTLSASQRTPPTPGQADKKPVLVPIAVGLVGPDGRDLPLTVDGAPVPGGATTAVLHLTQDAQSWTFSGVPAGVVPSVLRGFSAPVRLVVTGQTDADLAFLFSADSDPFNRWEAGQRLGRNALLALYDAAMAAVGAAGGEGACGDLKAVVDAALAPAAAAPVAALAKAFAALLGDGGLDGSFVARAISLPAEAEVVDALAASGAHGWANPVVVHLVRAHVVSALAAALRPQLTAAVAKADADIAAGEAATGGFATDFASMARRALRNKALGYLSALGDAGVTADLARRHAAASNMTDSIATLAALADKAGPERDAALDGFYARWAAEPLVLLKWLALQSGSSDAGAGATVQKLMAHPAFTITNPNACYSLFGPFCSTPAFHALDGSGYALLAGIVGKLDAVNGQVASRIVSAFTKYRSFDPARQALMRAQLEALQGACKSDNVREIVARSLAA